MKIVKDRAIFHHLFGLGRAIKNEENDSALCLFGSLEKEIPVGELILCATDANGQAILEGDVVFYPSTYYMTSFGRIPQVRQGKVIKVKNWFDQIFIKDDKTGQDNLFWPQSCIVKNQREDV